MCRLWFFSPGRCVWLCESVSDSNCAALIRYRWIPVDSHFMMYIIGYRSDRLSFALCALPTLNFNEVDCSWCDRSNVSEKKNRKLESSRSISGSCLCAHCATSLRGFFAISKAKKIDLCSEKRMRDRCVFFKAGNAARGAVSKPRRLKTIMR